MSGNKLNFICPSLRSYGNTGSIHMSHPCLVEVTWNHTKMTKIIFVGGRCFYRQDLSIFSLVTILMGDCWSPHGTWFQSIVKVKSVGVLTDSESILWNFTRRCLHPYTFILPKITYHSVQRQSVLEMWSVHLKVLFIIYLCSSTVSIEAGFVPPLPSLLHSGGDFGPLGDTTAAISRDPSLRQGVSSDENSSAD